MVYDNAVSSPLPKSIYDQQMLFNIFTEIISVQLKGIAPTYSLPKTIQRFRAHNISVIGYPHHEDTHINICP